MLMGMAQWRANFEDAWREDKNAAMPHMRRQDRRGLDYTAVK